MNSTLTTSRTAISNYFVFLSTVCYWEENLGKQIEIDLLTVLLSIPLNKLPWVERSSTAVSVAVVLLTVVPELPVVRIPAIPFLSVTLPSRSLFICLRLLKKIKKLYQTASKTSFRQFDFQNSMRRVWNLWISSDIVRRTHKFEKKNPATYFDIAI